MSEFFQSEAFQNALDILIHQFPLAIWETVYVTILSTFFAVVIGLPLGVLLVAGEHNRILRVPQWILSVLNVIINLLRSIPFLILMIPRGPFDVVHMSSNQMGGHSAKKLLMI